jgi:hypothetical protein
MRSALAGAIFVALTCFGSNAHAAGVPVAEASRDQLRAAEKTFHVADDLFDAKRYQEALTAYRASFDIVASPNSQLMMARSLIALGRLAEAYAELEAAIETADVAAKKDKKYAHAGRAAREELDRVTAKVARLSLTLGEVPAGTQLSIAGKAVEPSTLGRPLVLPPGTITLLLIAPDGREVRRELKLAAGSESSLRLELPSGDAPAEPAPVVTTPNAGATPAPVSDTGSKEGPSSLRVWAYVAGGVGIAGLATLGIFGSMSQSKFDSLESDCKDGHCPPDRGPDIEDGRRFQTIANVGLAVGIVGVGTGVTLFFLSSGKSEKRASGNATWIALGAGDVRMGGRF